jgi:hypothetical protein
LTVFSASFAIFAVSDFENTLTAKDAKLTKADTTETQGYRENNRPGILCASVTLW